MKNNKHIEKTHIYRICSNNKGTTMVETVVSFVVLVIILAVIYQMIAYCSELRMKAEDVDKMTRNVNKALYKSTVSKETDLVEAKPYVTDAKVKDGTEVIKGPLFYMEVDTEKTNSANVYSSVTKPDHRIWIMNINATGYKAVESGSSESDSTASPNQVPSVISFKYDN